MFNSVVCYQKVFWAPELNDAPPACRTTEGAVVLQGGQAGTGRSGRGGATGTQRERERHLFVWFGLTPSGTEEKKTQRAGWLDLTSTAGKTLLQSPSLEKLENHKIK